LDNEVNKQEPEQTQENLRELLEQHWLHCRHVENIRSQFMQVYAAIIVGFLGGFTYLFYKEKLISSWSGLISLFFVILVSLISLLLILRWSITHEFHRQKVNTIADQISPDKSIGRAMDVPPMRLPRWLSRRLRTRYLFPIFHFLIIIVLCFTCGFYVWNSIQCIWIIKIVLTALDLVFLALAAIFFYGGCKAIAEFDTDKSL
jgi:hypothetical protein